MSDFGKLFVSSIVAGGKDAYRLAVTRKITPDYIPGDGKVAWKYVIEHAHTYGEIPSRIVIQAKTGIDIGDPDGKAEFYVAEALTMRLSDLMQSGLGKVGSLMGQQDAHAAYKELLDVVKRVQESQLTHLPAQSIFKQVPEVIALYDRMKKGERGIPYPFKTMNDDTLGMWPQDLILFAARLGVGKSWNLLLLVRAAWEANKRVLLCTTEMSQLRMAQRFFAVQKKLPYPQFRKGDLPAHIEEAMKSGLVEMMNKDDGRLTILGGDFRFSIDSLHAEVDQAKPDLVVVDGAYLIESEGDNRFEQAANTFNALKTLANRTQIPFAVSSQFNREAKKNDPKTADISNIGLTDVGGWNADVAYAQICTDDMKLQKRMVYKPLKLREGQGRELECIWDIDNMHFEELINNDQSTPDYSQPHSNPSPQYDPNDPSHLF